MSSTYRTVAGPGSAETEVRRSRFRCTLERVESEDAARAVLDRCRRAYPDAGHHCSAFVIGPRAELERSSDDGEPSGTAGAPMLEVLRGHGITDVAAVVTRWFGGVLLGTGGLSRAYADAVRAALDTVRIQERQLRQLLEVEADHAVAGRLEHELRLTDATVQDVQYAEHVTFRIAVAPERADQVAATVAALTGGTTTPVPVAEVWVDV
ncbi:MAG TPA: YigZ family protein [Segeticoccus sp.]|uniref:YigZ family protein n=1 Tax=Segeticoccus sp. TaxID=2706531 RepID=UPI002D7EC9CB|nr:YigZ family protein [Segeticoccus sp.]HET8599383.1 YigZ family protein [Segeticoccus sp.]